MEKKGRTMDTIRDRLRRQFGPGAQTEEVGPTLLVHLDKPDGKEKERRRAEVRKGGPRDDDCELCKALVKTPPSVVVYDKDAVLCFGQDSRGPFASGFPRKARAAA